MTFWGPKSSVFSSRFFSCTGDIAGGGFYHDCTTEDGSLLISDCLFTHNCADSRNDSHLYRGGGGFENHRSSLYSSKYCFIFFHANIAKKGIGHDITSNVHPMPEGSVIHCFTTTAENSFCNAGTDQHVWLPLGTLS